MRKLFLIMMALLAWTWGVQAQTRTYHGTVLDAADNEPLVGATIMPIGGGQGVAADVDGNFTLTVPANVTKAKVSYVGYNTEEVTLANNMVVKLHSGASNLDEMIVVAYGTAKKSEYTGSASVVKADQLENTLVSDATSALAGRVAGVQIQSSNGQPGASPTVRVRGIGSINGSSAPLFVVDGVPFNGDINQIPTTDIESMTVLKDAASTALYGARGANGVILITTKSGREGNVTVNVDARWGVNQRGVADYDLVNDERNYMELVYQSLYNYRYYNQRDSQADAHSWANAYLWNVIGYQTWTAPEGQTFIGTDGKFNPGATRGYITNGHLFLSDNWVKESFKSKLRQEYNVSASGGTGKLNYYASFSYLGDNGIIDSSSFDRLNTSLNVDYQLYKWLKFNTNMNYTYTDWNYPSDQTTTNSSGNVFALANQFGPMYPFYIREEDGSISIDEHTGKYIYSYGDNEYGFTRNVMRNANPAGGFAYDTMKNVSDIFRGKWSVIISPIEGLDISGTIGLHIDNTQYQSYTNPWYGQFASYHGMAQQIASRTRTIDEQVLAQYTKTINDANDISVMVGWESDGYENTVTSGYGYNIYQPGNPFINNTLPDTRMANGYQYKLSHQAIFARANYSYNGKYHAMVSYRRDGSSRFAPGHRWGNFFSVSAGWDIAKEKFMQEATAVDMLKLKASFGQNGNDNLGISAPYGLKPYEDFYQITGADGVWSDGTLTYKGNYDITWEKSNAFNVGVDYSFFHGMLSGSIEYFSRQTSDMLMYVQVPASLGYSSIPMNAGSMRNSGLEVEINYTPFDNKNVKWDLNLNFTVPQNKVIKLEPSLVNDKGEWISGTRYFKEGQSMYQLYLAKYAGVDPENGHALYWAKDENGAEYKTEIGDDARSTNSVSTGNILPKIYGGFSTSVEFFGVDVTASLSFQLGGRIFDSSYQQYMYTGDGSNLGDAFHKDILKAWTENNRNTDVPMLSYVYNQSTPGNYYYTDRWLVSSNYLSLNNVTVGYTIPQHITERIKISQLRVYFAAENIALWSARKGLDPRQSYLTSSNSLYSPIRTLSGGIHITF